MSFQRRRGHHQRDDADHNELPESPDQKLKNAILKLGEVDPVQEVPRLAAQIAAHQPSSTSAVAEAFRIAVTEQPYKTPYYAALLRQLSSDAADPATSQGPEFGKQVLEEFWKGFQAFLDKLAWREIRLCIHFFAHLAAAHVISISSMLELIRAITVVLDEFGVSHGRAKQAVRCATEGLMIIYMASREEPSDTIPEMIDAIKSYVASASRLKQIVRPVPGNFAVEATVDVADELLDLAVTALEALQDPGSKQDPEPFPRPYEDVPGPVVFELPSVLVPPEVIELDSLSDDNEGVIKKAEWAEFHVRLFDNDVTPNPSTPIGYSIRCGLLDILDIFEVNRKECARLLLEFPKWTSTAVFQSKSPGAPQQPAGGNWQLECTIIEAALGQLFLLPEPIHKSVYYMSLITELAKLSPPSVGPAVGKSIRKMYSLLSDGLDIAIVDRLASWFSVHMSNFNFMWVWKEWTGDLELSPQHPKRIFMRRAVEYEIRLSYFDRIVKTLPESMQSPDAEVLPAAPPGPTFTYDDPATPHHDAAQSVLNLLRNRSTAEEVMNHLEEMKNSLETADSDRDVASVIRTIAVQSLLHIGSRSFSHFLNAIERYLPLLRNLAAGGISTGGSPSSEARNDILSAVLAFWQHNKHMVVIVFDKLMQYQIVDTPDVINWTFRHAGTHINDSQYHSCTFFQWDLVKGALDKANGRVVVARRRLAAVRKEEDENAARAMANHAATMDIDETKPDPVVESPAVANAVKAFTSLKREQIATLNETLSGFFFCLGAPDSAAFAARDILNEASWNNRANWSQAEWLSWETWAWYQHFCRMYSPYLRSYASSLDTVTSLQEDTQVDSATKLFKRILNISCDVEVE